MEEVQRTLCWWCEVPCERDSQSTSAVYDGHRDPLIVHAAVIPAFHADSTPERQSLSWEPTLGGAVAARCCDFLLFVGVVPRTHQCWLQLSDLHPPSPVLPGFFGHHRIRQHLINFRCMSVQQQISGMQQFARGRKYILVVLADSCPCVASCVVRPPCATLAVSLVPSVGCLQSLTVCRRYSAHLHYNTVLDMLHFRLRVDETPDPDFPTPRATCVNGWSAVVLEAWLQQWVFADRRSRFQTLPLRLKAF